MGNVTESLTSLAYLVAAVLFIMALRGLSSPETSRKGNFFGMLGMLIAVVTTVLSPAVTSYGWIIIALAIGAVIGIFIARKIAMTAMPQLVAAFHSLVGMAAVLVASAFSTTIYKALDNRVFAWIAKLSFSIYLWHMVFIVFIERKVAKNYVYNGFTDTSDWALLSCIVLAGSICIAALSWRFLESPVLQYARKAPQKSHK